MRVVGDGGHSSAPTRSGYAEGRFNGCTPPTTATRTRASTALAGSTATASRSRTTAPVRRTSRALVSPSVTARARRSVSRHGPRAWWRASTSGSVQPAPPSADPGREVGLAEPEGAASRADGDAAGGDWRGSGRACGCDVHAASTTSHPTTPATTVRAGVVLVTRRA